MDNRLKGGLLTVAGVTVLSLDALLIKLISADPWILLFWRGMLLSLCIGSYCLYRARSYRPTRKLLSLGLGSALFYAVCTVTFVISIRLTSVANTLIILSAAPLIGALLSRFVLKESVSGRTWLAILLCLGGLLLVFSGSRDGNHLLGDLIALLCAASMAAKFVVERAASPANMTPALVPAGLLVSLFALFQTPTLAVPSEDILWMALLGLVVVPLAYALITQGPRYLSAPEVGLIMLLEMVLGPLWVWLVLAEQPSQQAWMGGLVVVAALVCQSWPGRRSKASLVKRPCEA
ncbi:DMT family transporter [Zobellella maritima]|uniref:DMT family transporter n=1 Tax=Zobellella maritima TaxID=2059725 RepID=UPI000E308ABE|nr:DMT family transporter [Zobellella maritima]